MIDGIAAGLERDGETMRLTQDRDNWSLQEEAYAY